MGGVISKVSDLVVEQACSCFCLEVNRICRLNKNLEALEKAMQKLEAKRDDVYGRVQRDEGTGLQRYKEVQLWLTNVRTAENQVDETRRACTSDLQGLSPCEVCLKKLESRFRYGKKVFSMLEDVQELIDRKVIGDFNTVAGPPARDVVEEMTLQPTFGQETMLTMAWNLLMDDGRHIMGLFGMGGIGKTTLLKQIHNKFCGANDGAYMVIWVVVSKDKGNEKIQDEIGEILGLSTEGESWNQKTETRKASSIRISMSNKRFVLFLDDIWSKVELTEIGVPLPTKENKCKIVFTTRLSEVCSSMGVDDPIEVKYLDFEVAWDLFRSKVRQTALESHPDIPQLARKVAEKCCGLPLALNVIGETMSSKRTIQEWRHAINTLKSSAAKFSGMNKILPILKYSYNSLREDANLEEEHTNPLQSCFLYCSLFPEDNLLGKERLIEYWIGEGFIDENEGRERALDQGYEILGTLISTCLLLQGEKNKSDVKMHDVVREMAIWVASDLEERCIIQPGVGLREIPKGKNWKNVRRMSLMGTKIENISESLDCPELTTLILRENRYLRTISGEFFQSMPKLLVLDFSENRSLCGLPDQISGLVSLRYLDLSGTKIERLPVGLQELKMLIHLNLGWTSKLESLRGISKLLSLRTLNLRQSKVWLDMKLMKELQLLKHLEFISINISSSLVGKLLLYDPRMERCIQQVSIGERSEDSVRVLVLPAMDNLSKVSIRDCGICDVKIEKTPWSNRPASPCFSNLYEVRIEECNGLKDLTWLLFAPNLTHLIVRALMQVEDIISREKAASVLDKETCNILPFRKLEVLSLCYLPELKSIYWNALPFQFLRQLHVNDDCPKLRKLALDSKSVFKLEEFLIKYDEKEWIERVEWEDEATRLRFLPSCRLYT